jgi:flagellar biosynthesis protein FliR
MKKSTYVVLIILFFLALAAVGTFFVVVEDLGGRAVDVPARGYLEVPLSGAVVEVAPPTPCCLF